MVEKKEKPEWVKMKPAEVEKIVLDLHKQGNTPARIGLILRDQHGIPKAKLLGKRITEILVDNKISVNPEKEILEKKMKALQVHIAKNKHDYTSKRSLTKKLWIAKKLA